MLDGTTVLIAEDEKSLRRLYASWLDHAGAIVLTAEAGPSALEKWTDDVDVVLLDRRMPEEYGDEVLKTARGRGLHTPVAMITAVTPDLDLIDIPFDDYITKPTTEEELCNVVESLLTRGEIRETVREFARAGVTLHALQQEHSHDLLQTHDEYQQLHHSYNELREEVSALSDDLSTYEKQLLIRARNRL